MPKVLITPRSYAQYSDEPLKKMADAGITIVKNPLGGILEKSQMLDYIKGIDGIILGVDPMDADVLAAGTDLKVVSKYGVGTDNIDLEYCKSHNITVTITQNANSHAVADYAFALILAVARKVVEIDKACRQGDWGKKVAVDVFGKKIGVVGLGAIGRGVVARAKGFSMEVYGFDVFKDETYIKDNNIRFAEVNEMMKECDFISLHLPLTPETKHMINASNLKTAKKNLIIVNTARGGIIKEADLVTALKNGTIMGVGVDVFETEPANNSELLTLDNAIVGSHCGASTVGAVDIMSSMAADNIIREFKKRGLI